MFKIFISFINIYLLTDIKYAVNTNSFTAYFCYLTRGFIMSISRRSLLGLGLSSVPAMFLLEQANANEQPAVVQSDLVLLNDSLVFTDTSSSLLFSKSTDYKIYSISGDEVLSGEGNSVPLSSLTDFGIYSIKFGGKYANFLLLNKTFSPNNFFGICVNFANASVRSYHDPNKLLPDLKKIGVSSVRDTFVWEELEQTKGNYNFSDFYTNKTKLYTSLGLNQLYCASSTNKLYGSWRNLDNYNTRVAYANHILTVLKNNPHLKSVEVYNEFNNKQFNAGNLSGKNYASLLKDVYPIIKKSRPDIEVIAGATAGEAVEFAKEFFNSGGGHYMDAWSWHPYSVSGRGLYDNADLYTKLMSDNGVTGKSLYITEIGWSITDQSNTYGNNAKSFSELDQAENLSNTMFGAWLSSKISSYYWYNALTTGTEEERKSISNVGTEANFGLFAYSPSIAPNTYVPRLSAYAYYKTRLLLEEMGRNLGHIRRDSRYKYPVILGTAKDKLTFAVNTSGWISGNTDLKAFDKLVPFTALGFSTNMYYKIDYPCSKTVINYGNSLTSKKDTAFVTLSKTPIKGGIYGLSGAIKEYYDARGGSGFFGGVVSAEEPIGTGSKQTFTNNRTIYWHEETGALEVWDSSLIGKRFNIEGVDSIGFPKTPETRSKLNRYVWYQEFYNPVTGLTTQLYRFPDSKSATLLVLNNGIGTFISQNIGYGHPITDELPNKHGGVYQEFKTNSGKINRVMWCEQLGAGAVQLNGALGKNWVSRGYEGGLGYPIDKERRDGNKYYTQSYKNLDTGITTECYWSLASGVIELPTTDLVYKKWVSQGKQSAWGYPTKKPYTLGSNVIYEFEKVFARLNTRNNIITFSLR